MGPRSILRRVYCFLQSDISDLDASSLIIGAVLAIVVSAAVGPIITAGVAHSLNDQGIPPYQSPSVDFRMDSGDGQYAVYGEDLEEFNGAIYNNSTRLYEITLNNPSSRAVHDLDISLPLPGCVIDYSASGVGSEADIIDYVELDLRGQGEGLREFSCSKTISVEQLDPNDHVSIRFLLRVSFERCDLLEGGSTTNQMVYNYQWQKNGIQFSESGQGSIGFTEDYANVFGDMGEKSVQGKRISSHGIMYSSYVVGVDEPNIASAMGNCRLSNEDQD